MSRLLTIKERYAWAKMIDAERPQISYEALAGEIEDRMRDAAKEPGHSEAIAEALENHEVTTNAAHLLCGFPANPLSSPKRCAMVIGLADVCGIDRSVLSRLGGGI